MIFFNIAFGFVLFGGFFGDAQWNAVTVINTALNFAATLPQIQTNFNRKSTGQLSFITYFINWSATGARVGTIFFETDDILMKCQYLASWGLGLIIQIQFFLYWDEKSKVEEKEKK